MIMSYIKSYSLHSMYRIHSIFFLFIYGIAILFIGCIGFLNKSQMNWFQIDWIESKRQLEKAVRVLLLNTRERRLFYAYGLCFTLYTIVNMYWTDGARFNSNDNGACNHAFNWWNNKKSCSLCWALSLGFITLPSCTRRFGFVARTGIRCRFISYCWYYLRFHWNRFHRLT